MHSKIVAIVLVLMLTLGCLPSLVLAKDSPVDTSSVLKFLSDVACLDLATYEITGNNSFLLGDPNSPGYYITDGKYTMHYWNIQTETYHSLETMFQFENTSLTRVSIDNRAGTILYSKAYPSNLHDAVTVFLDRYQAFTGDASLETMKNMLTGVNLVENSSKVSDDIKLEVRVYSNDTVFRWIDTINGVDYGVFTVTFRQNVFYEFGDSRGHYFIGNPAVNISKEQAIALALKRAESFSYTYKNKTVSVFNIVKDQIRIELKANTRYEYCLYYPCWIVDLPLDEYYPGGVYEIQVTLWADNGEINSCKSFAAGGFNPDRFKDNPTPEPTQAPVTQSPTENASIIQDNEFPTLTITIIVFAIALVVAVSGVVFLKKRTPKFKLLF